MNKEENEVKNKQEEVESNNIDILLAITRQIEELGQRYQFEDIQNDEQALRDRLLQFGSELWGKNINAIVESDPDDPDKVRVVFIPNTDRGIRIIHGLRDGATYELTYSDGSKGDLQDEV